MKLRSDTQALESVAKSLPSLIRAEKLQNKAAKVGFDWDTPDGALQKIPEETAELLQAVSAEDRDNTFEELGDLLFAAVNAARKLHIDAEEALTAATDKFQSRFIKVEALAKNRVIDMENTPLETLDRLWDEVKAAEKQES